jgi:hypothetical protein
MQKSCNCNASNCIVFFPDISRFHEKFVQKLHLFANGVDNVFHAGAVFAVRCPETLKKDSKP